MRKIYTYLTAALAAFTLQTQAQTILEEGFETGNTGSNPRPVASGQGWTTVDSYTGTNQNYVWHNYYSDPESDSGSTISGAGCAACDGPITASGVVDGSGPREEILLSPELDLNDTYQLQFTWRVSPMNAMDYSRYDLQVRVVEGGNLAGAETVFSIQNQQMLKESGVTVFPINTWDPHTSTVDLSDWKGSKVKLAFVYKMYTTSSNVVWLDDISVKKFTPATGPVPSVSLDRYNFGNVYIGEKFYTDVIRLTNTGKNGLKITDVTLPQGVSINIDYHSVNLDKNDQVSFQLSYTASMTSPAQADAIIHTNGGDVKIALQATKQFVPDGYLLESFEGYFPPAGWRNNGWGATTTAFEGDQSAYCSGGFSNSYLRSPRLDLSDGGKLIFTYYNMYDGEYAPEYDIEVQVSYDGGDNWQTKWTSDYQTGLNQLLTAEVDLGQGSDDSYVRFYYPAIESDDEGAFDHSDFTLDRVLLPHVFGAEGVPGNCTLISPANNATDVYPRDIVLSWGPAQFAKGYKVYVGSNDEMNNLVDGANVNSDLSITIPVADYETTYKWKVVAYNDKGESTTASTWRFTTQKDASVMEFPWEENFDACTNSNPVPEGWLSTTTGQYAFAKWSPNSIYAYGGKGVCMSSGWLNAGESTSLLSPEFKLPAEGKAMSISFVWGNAHPSDLIIDESGLLKKQNVEQGTGNDEVVFEIFADGAWKQLSYLSEPYNEDNETKYWRNENVDLTEYAGKTVQFRWTTNCFKTYSGYGTLDNIVVNGLVSDYATFNKDGWDAGKVNYGKAATSGEQLTMLNRGKNALKVKAVTFGTENFTSSIAAGDEIAVDDGLAFTVQFDAKDANKKVDDVMTVEFESGAKAEFPVSGEGLAEDVLYYGFENNALDYVWTTDFTTIDVDKQVNYKSNYYLTTIDNDGGRYAFTQAYHYNPNLTAHTGIGTLAACAPDNNSAANDWLISKRMCPADGATLDFYARNLSTTNSVFVGDNDLHRVTVLVSEGGNTNTADFQVAMADTEMPYLAENEWNHYTVDLSPWAGKNIYVAVRHTTVSANWLAFFDDFTFSHVGPAAEGQSIESVLGSMTDAEVEVFTVNGVKVAGGRGAAVMESLDKGFYIVNVKNGSEVKTIRVARK